MGSENSETLTLTKLGLTSTQARVYLTLVKYGASKISLISKFSKIARPDIYRTISNLQELGLVEQLVETPVQFRAIPIKEAIEFLLKSKTQEYEETKKETQVLVNAYKDKESKHEPLMEDSRFILVSPKDAVIKKQNEMLMTVKKSIDLILSWKRFCYGSANIFKDCFRAALERKIEFRYILETPTNRRELRKALDISKKYPNFHVKFIPEPPKTVFGIYDSKEIFITVDLQTDLPGYSPALWTKNECLLAVIEDYFDILWLTAMEKPAVKVNAKQVNC
jgi:sugar-specific transcriptional regulator TrmB